MHTDDVMMSGYEPIAKSEFRPAHPPLIKRISYIVIILTSIVAIGLFLQPVMNLAFGTDMKVEESEMNTLESLKTAYVELSNKQGQGVAEERRGVLNEFKHFLGAGTSGTTVLNYLGPPDAIADRLPTKSGSDISAQLMPGPVIPGANVVSNEADKPLKYLIYCEPSILI